MDFMQLQWLAQFGLGAVFGVIMFMIYRHDRACTEDKMKVMVNDYHEVIRENNELIQKNIEVQTKMITLLESCIKK